MVQRSFQKTTVYTGDHTLSMAFSTTADLSHINIKLDKPALAPEPAISAASILETIQKRRAERVARSLNGLEFEYNIDFMRQVEAPPVEEMVADGLKRFAKVHEILGR